MKMSDLSKPKQMMWNAYSIYLELEKQLDLSTRNNYRKKAIDYLENPEKFESPPHWSEAKAEIQDYTS